ncbi:MAG: tripartite tricarboxylate transporter TctB family protein [bacterium]|nr:tripartite tricarboxylate transporter TctB family protein [bacterium]
MQHGDPPGAPPTGQAVKVLGDLVAGLFLVVVAWAGRASVRAGQAQLQFDFDTDPGPYLVPEVLLLVVGAGGIVLVAAGAWRLARSARVLTPSVRWPENALRLLLVAAFVASMALYLRLLVAVGFRPATFALCTVWVFILARQAQQRPLLRDVAASLVIAAVVTGAVHFVFKSLVRVPLP